ncbi:hypothetical protein ACSBR2_015828 [Camellia fascicularis]
MAIDDQKSSSDGKILGLFKLPFRQSVNSHSTTSSSSSSHIAHHQSSQVEGSNPHSNTSSSSSSSSSSSVSSAARSLLPTRRRLRLDPSNKLYFPYEPGKQVQSAIRIKNTSKSYVAFKFQTTAPKSCFMRPPGAILAPGETIIATVFKFVEPPENNEKPLDQKSKVKFKIMSTKSFLFISSCIVIQFGLQIAFIVFVIFDARAMFFLLFIVGDFDADVLKLHTSTYGHFEV